MNTIKHIKVSFIFRSLNFYWTKTLNTFSNLGLVPEIVELIKKLSHIAKYLINNNDEDKVIRKNTEALIKGYKGVKCNKLL